MHVIGVIVSIAAFACSAQAQITLSEIAPPVGTPNILVFGVSGDGQVVVGSGGTNGAIRAVRWTSAGGSVQLPNLATGSGISLAQAANIDGSVITGYVVPLPGAVEQPFRWTAATGTIGLGLPPGFTTARGTGISDDGNTISGWGAGPNGRSFRWRAVGGYLLHTPLPTFQNHEAFGISGDGNVIVGWSAVPFSNKGTLWYNGGLIVNMGNLVTNGASYAWATNHDGSIVVGAASLVSTKIGARWSGGSLSPLTPPATWTTCDAFGVSDDGSVIVGTGGVGASNRAWIWTSATGVVDLNSYLPSVGVPLGTWTLTGAVGISDDGTTIVGNGRLGTLSRGFIIRGICTTPVTTTNPVSASACAAGPVIFSASASGGGLTYAWQFESAPGVWTPLTNGTLVGFASVAGADLPTLSLTNMTGSAATNYRCVMTNSCGTVTSFPATLTLLPADIRPCSPPCDSIDFNNNGVFPEDQDVIDFFDVLAGTGCPACNDIDFNNNGVFPEDADVIDFFTVLAGGACP